MLSQLDSNILHLPTLPGRILVPPFLVKMTQFFISVNFSFYHGTLLAHTIPQETLRELLTICTTDTPFSFNNKTNQEIDGVSMGSPLGPAMAEYYMSSSETFLLNQTKIYNPLFYVRYVFKSNDHIRHFINRLQNNSVLIFTSEQQQNNSFHFLDVQFTITENIIETSVYIKPSDRGMCCARIIILIIIIHGVFF